MSEVIIALTLIGLVSLTASLKPACVIKKASHSETWTLLCGLLFSFVIGYIFILYFVITNAVDNGLGVALAAILAGGGVFVYIVTGLSLKSITKLSDSLEHQRYLGEHDTITGHFNRTKFNTDLQHKTDNQHQFDLILFFISQYKHLIDVHDYEFVESLLYQFSQRVFDCLTIDATLYRIDGDEFVLLVDNHKGDEVNNALMSITDALREEFQVLNLTLQIDVFMGISRYPTMATKGKTLFKQADLALHEAHAKNTRYVFYSDELGIRADNTIKMHEKIKAALQNDEFELYLQPINDAKTNKPDGAEALIRWPQKDGTFIYPDIFIAIAEQSGLINDISRWVVAETIKIISRLERENFSGTIHVNLSTSDLESKQFCEFIQQQLIKKPTISSSIIFEITEHAMMTNFKDARETMIKLSNLGFKFSIDDFGTGFSSMTLLRELPISQIKIDRSFVKDMLIQRTDYAIVESTLFLASKLNCDVVAEGVENQELQHQLSTMGCQLLQGYYFSKPLPVEDYIKTFIRKTLVTTH